MAFTTLREGAFFTSFGIGRHESFFGFKRGHGEVLAREYVIGHENLFFHMADVESSGGDLVSYAKGRSVGLAAEQDFHPAEHLEVRLSANFEKFLGGEAKIPFGKMEMDEGEWNRRLAVSAEYTVHEGTTLGFDTGIFFPGGESPEAQTTIRFRRTF